MNAGTISEKTCQPYSWNSKGTVVVSGQIFISLAIDNEFNIYVVPKNRAQILKWAPNAVEPVIMDMKPSLLECISYHPKRNAIYFSDSRDRSIKRLSLGETAAVKVAFGNGYGSALNQYKTAHDLFVDDDDTIFVLDSFNARVLKWPVDADTAIVIAAGGGDGKGPSQLASSPSGAAQFFVDRIHDEIYVADTWNYRVQKYDMGSVNGTTVLSVEANGVAYPISVILDGNGDILVGLDNRILKYKPGSNHPATIIADGPQGSGPAMNAPTDLRFDRAGNLYTIDFQLGRVLRFDVTNSSCLF